MVVRWICGRCGHLLREFKELHSDFTYNVVPKTNDVVKDIGRCPNCGKELELPEPDDIEIKALEVELYEMEVK